MQMELANERVLYRALFCLKVLQPNTVLAVILQGHYPNMDISVYGKGVNYGRVPLNMPILFRLYGFHSNVIRV